MVGVEDVPALHPDPLPDTWQRRLFEDHPRECELDMNDYRYWLPFVALGGGIGIAVLADRVLGGTPYFNLFTLAVDLAVPTTGFVIWIRRGHSWLAALSWSVPLGVLCSGIALVPDLAPILRLTAAEICILLGVGMVIIPEFMSWWYARILRASPPN